MMPEVSEVKGYTASDEGRHSPSADPWWQESVAFHWFDADNGVGGMHRIGHEPNGADGARIVHQHGVFDRQDRFRRLASDPGQPEHAASWFGNARANFSCEGGRPHFVMNEDGVYLDLTFTDFYPLTDFFPRGSASLDEEFASHHYETSFTAVGTAVVAGREYQVRGLGHRDHSWGVRKWHEAIAVHRWVSGVIDESLAFGSIFWLGPDGPLVGGGYVVDEGVVKIADSADIVVHLEADGLTHRGGVFTLDVEGELFVFECEALDGWVSIHHDVIWVDELCRARFRDRVGYANVEISNNVRMGTAPVRLATRAALSDGLDERRGR